MSGSRTPITSVPTNIITGFLGVGKTTAILHLLKSKPSRERWAVLVNEFGEVGIDGRMMEGSSSEEQGVYVREVPGGCMCCAAGLPMQVALNQLLSAARPDRLLIEPTGLGHPKEVLQVLQRGAYRNVLNVQQIVTLVNARHLADTRYTDDENFNQQIEVADIIVGNKADLYQQGDEDRLRAYLQEGGRNADGGTGVKLAFTTNGALDWSMLEGETGYTDAASQDQSTHHHHAQPQALDTDSLPECGYVKKANKGDGYYSVGWRFREDMVFQRERLFSFLSGIDAERVKAVMNTEAGVYGYNVASGSLTELQLFGGGQSCIEIIAPVINDSRDDGWEAQLLQCISTDSIAGQLQ